jgi:hypothetical protein
MSVGSMRGMSGRGTPTCLFRRMMHAWPFGCAFPIPHAESVHSRV